MCLMITYNSDTEKMSINKILSAQQIGEADSATIAYEPILEIDLMERAATLCAYWLREKLAPGARIHLLCGPGNNGGDGLVVARWLAGWGFKTSVWMVSEGSLSNASEINTRRLIYQKLVKIHPFEETKVLFNPKPGSVIIDAMFGAGFNRMMDREVSQVVQMVNRGNYLRIALDLPSGLTADGYAIDVESCFKAHYTITFLPLKRMFVLPENEEFFGSVITLDIGLNRAYLATADPLAWLITDEVAGAIYRPRKRFVHKGQFGHALLIGGKREMGGAILMTASACLASGAGKTTLLVSEGMLSAINSSLPGAMTSIIDDAAVTIDLTIHPYNVVAVGPGMGTDNIAQERLYSILTKFRGSLVLDADALNILSQNKGWLKLLPPNSILTPHPAEFARLFGEVDNSLEAFNLQQEMSDKYQIVIIRKGANSSITFPGEKIWFNTSGNPALAKGGTGDILTGVIAGLLAQGYTAKEAALFATWLHGKAADEAIRSVGIEAADSSDIIDGIKRVFKQLNML